MEQLVHLYGLSFEWINACSFNLLEFLKYLRQLIHSKGLWFDFSPLCMFKWALRLPPWEDEKSHWLHLFGSLSCHALLFNMLINRQYLATVCSSLYKPCFKLRKKGKVFYIDFGNNLSTILPIIWKLPIYQLYQYFFQNIAKRDH